MKPFFWPLACGAPSPHQSNALKGVGRRELVTFSEFFACNLHASCIQLTELQRWNSENKISCMRLMLSGFHHWSPVSCMQVACNAMQFSRVSLFYTFSLEAFFGLFELSRSPVESSNQCTYQADEQKEHQEHLSEHGLTRHVPVAWNQKRIMAE